jgi:tRNA nucleotidyltransferase (CCA-adding enzyme)
MARTVSLLDLMRRAPGAEPALDALGGEPGMHVVGGAVRDALLGNVPRELDFVVEGDAAAAARRAAARIGGEVVVHERFGTATVRAPAAAFDVVSARTETYERPGALPDVRPGATIEEDLGRRDFTVNAIALRLADGAEFAFPGAREDLAAGRLRVLHERSFEDDPTRLLRMARYAARLGFEPDPATDALAAAATVDTVSGGRLGSELRLLLRERQPAAVLALERHGLGRAVVHPGFSVTAELVEHALSLCPPDARWDLVALATTVVGTDGQPHELGAALDRLEFDATSRGIVAKAAHGAHLLCDALEPGPGDEPGSALGDADLWRTLHRRTPEAVAVAGALGRGGPAEHNARRWLDDVRHRRLAITGDDFVAAGLTGPAVGEALQAAQLAALAGEAPDAAAQLAAGLAAVRGGRGS